MDNKSEVHKIEQEKQHTEPYKAHYKALLKGEQGRKTTLTQYIVYSIIIYFFIILLFSMVQITE